MSDIKELTEKIKQFREERDWTKFHNPKDVAISLALEAAEVLEHFQWKSLGELDEYIKNNREEIGDELADVAIYLFGLADDMDIDLREAIERKMVKNAKKYPVEKVQGSTKKYTQYS